MRNNKFNTKEEYLAYRSDWKAEYKTLSEKIRQLKTDIRDIQRNREYAGRKQYSLIELKSDATFMLEELKLAKMEANRQYLAKRTLANI